MDLLMITLLCILATSKVTVQGVFAKTNIKSTYDAIFFNGLVFLFSALIFARNLTGLNLPVFLFGSVFGVLTVLFQVFYIKAMSCGNVSLTVLIVNLSMIIPIVVSVVAYGERLTALRLAGLVLTVLALGLSAERKREQQKFKRWFYLSIGASLCNAGISVCQKIFSKTPWQGQVRPFVSGGYAVAALIAFAIVWILKRKNEDGLKLNLKMGGFALSIGLILGVFQALNTKAIAMIDGTLFFPSYNGGVLILSYFSSLLILKERIRFKQILSLCIGIFAVILMSL